MSSFADYEKIGSFYLGKKFELAGRKLLDEKVLYDAKDLTTHAMCVGMTGSGKTGLCLSLLEEAALDGIPAICVDPKGDLGNLLLAFPELRPEDFKPWLESAEAARKNLSLDEYAEQTASNWRHGLESWDQDASRVRNYKDAVDIAIYTPGSNAGIPMTVLKSFNAPPEAVLNDAEVMRERVAGAASGLLTLLGIEADPLSSREHILLANIFDSTWRKNQSLDLPSLIRAIQAPPLEKIGVFDLESFYPAAERMKLSMRLNNLLASPTFSGWLEGSPLDIKQLLYTAQGKPRISIISIAHLSDSERMFFVTILLNELLSWMRTQPGTSSLRAMFYMDEVFGYFPPSAKPPSKPPMLVLLKQARAFGLGIALATQNPVDLDYKGLSNIGTWFLGRLQTQRDKERVLEGLEGAAAQSGTRFNRGEMEQTLAALGSRVFLMNNVHDDGPTIFQTRWAMSYLRGPLSRTQIQQLMDPRRKELDSTAKAPEPESTSQVSRPLQQTTPAQRPIVPNDVNERFWIPARVPRENSKTVYRAALLGTVSCHYVRASANLDQWFDKSILVQIGSSVPEQLWQQSCELSPGSLELSQHAEADFRFSELPSELLNDKNYKSWVKDLRDYLYRHAPLRLFECKELKQFSLPGQDEADARMHWSQAIREQRDEAKEELHTRYAKRLQSLEEKIRNARQRLEKERAQYDKEKWNTALNFGQTILGAILGNKISSRTASTGRSAGRAAQQRTDVLHAGETLADLERERSEIVLESETELRELKERFSIENLTLEPLDVPCRKGDLKVDLLALLWIPWEIDSQGIATPLVQLPSINRG
ncbi:MAG: ATP-binding protein [Planctomycetales bacterium]|nr:ATP-binding protein [Planctomycetales bacterium]